MLLAAVLVTGCFFSIPTVYRSPVAGALPNATFPSLRESLSADGLRASYHSVERYPLAGGTDSVQVRLQNAPQRLGFDGLQVYLPFYVIQNAPEGSTDRFAEPPHTIIGSHYVGLNLLDNSVSVGDSAPAGTISGHDYRRITPQTGVYPNQRIYYHQGRDSIPVLDELLPPSPVAGRWSTALPVRVLTHRNSRPAGFLYEAVSLEHALFFGLAMDAEGYSEIAILAFSSPYELVSHLVGDLRDRDGYHIVTGRNRSGYDALGFDEEGGRFLGRIDDSGRQGRGAYFGPDGVRRYGVFRNDLSEGPTVMYQVDGSTHFGFFSGGELVSDLVERSAAGVLSVIGAGNSRSPYQSPLAQLGNRWVVFQTADGTKGVSVDGRYTLERVRSSSGDVLATITDGNGNFIDGIVREGDVPFGTYVSRLGFTYQGKLQGLVPHGNGRVVHADGRELVGYFRMVDGAPLGIVARLTADISYPAAREVALRITVMGETETRILEPNEGGNWTASFQVPYGEAIHYDVLVNGELVTDPTIYSSPATEESHLGSLLPDSEGVQVFEAAGFTLDLAVESIEDEPREDTDSSGSDIQAFVNSLNEATEAYFRRADAEWSEVYSEIETATAVVAATTIDVLEAEGSLDTSALEGTVFDDALESVRETARRSELYRDFSYGLQMDQAIREGDYRTMKDLFVGRLAEDPETRELAEFLDEVGDAAFDVYEESLRYQEELAASRGAVAASDATAVAATAVEARRPVWGQDPYASKPNVPPNSTQLYTLVAAADHYHQQHVAFAQQGNAEQAARMFQGHVASVKQVTDFLALGGLDDAPGF